MEKIKPEKPTEKFNFKKIFFIVFVILVAIFILMIGGPGVPGGKTIMERITKVLIVIFSIGLLSLVIAWVAKVIALSSRYIKDNPIRAKRESVERETLRDVSQDTQKEEEKELKSATYNKLAITGFILSIVSILGIRLAGLIGFILGIVALVQIKYTKGKGKGLAIAAIIIGFIKSFVMSILEQLINIGL